MSAWLERLGERVAGTAVTLLRRTVDVKDEEVNALCRAFGAFFYALAAYFLLLPLRDEAGVSVGTSQLPSLFCVSLLLTLLAAPITSGLLSQPRANQGAVVQQLARAVSASIIGFFILYAVFFTEHRTDDGEQHVSRRLLAASQAGSDGRGGDAALTLTQRGIKCGFFLWVSLLNLMTCSTLWTRMADVFSSESSKRLFGVIGAGATLGQLVGSSCGVLWSFTAPRFVRSQPTSAAAPPFALPMILAALLYEMSGRCAASMHLPRKTLKAPVEGSVSPDAVGPPSRGPSPARGDPEVPLEAAPRSFIALIRKSAIHTAHTALQGMSIISSSAYLRHLCGYLTLNYITSSFFYFQKSVVVSASGRSSAARTQFFGMLNTCSALVMAIMQLTATGPVLHTLGMPWSLTLTPLCSCVLMLALGMYKSEHVLPIVEVVRKMLIYSVARPAREVLFTVIPQQDKYKVKIFIDTLMQRFGDVLAAGLFQALDRVAGAAPPAVTAASIPFILCWALTGFTLGRRHDHNQCATGPKSC